MRDSRKKVTVTFCAKHRAPTEGWSGRSGKRWLSPFPPCDGEISETDTSLDFARDCGYITAQQHRELTGLCQEVGKMLGSIINNPTSFLLSPPCPLPSAF